MQMVLTIREITYKRDAWCAGQNLQMGLNSQREGVQRSKMGDICGTQMRTRAARVNIKMRVEWCWGSAHASRYRDHGNPASMAKSFVADNRGLRKRAECGQCHYNPVFFHAVLYCAVLLRSKLDELLGQMQNASDIDKSNHHRSQRWRIERSGSIPS